MAKYRQIKYPIAVDVGSAEGRDVAGNTLAAAKQAGPEVHPGEALEEHHRETHTAGSPEGTPESPPEIQREGRLTRKIKSMNSFVDNKLGELDPVAALLWVILLRHAYDGIVEISHARLAKIVGKSPRTVIRHLKELELKRLLRRLKVGGKGRGVNRYNLGHGLPGHTK